MNQSPILLFGGMSCDAVLFCLSHIFLLTDEIRISNVHFMLKCNGEICRRGMHYEENI